MLHIITHPDYDIPLAEGHRFPSRKFTRLISHLDAEGILAKFTQANLQAEFEANLEKIKT